MFEGRTQKAFWRSKLRHPPTLSTAIPMNCWLQDARRVAAMCVVQVRSTSLQVHLSLFTIVSARTVQSQAVIDLDRKMLTSSLLANCPTICLHAGANSGSSDKSPASKVSNAILPLGLTSWLIFPHHRSMTRWPG